MKNIKRILVVLVLFISLIFSTMVKADSDWGTSYDSSSSSSWSSSDSSWSSSNSSYSSSGGEADGFTVLVIFIIVVIIIVIANKNNPGGGTGQNSAPVGTQYNRKDMSQDEINKIDSSLNREETINKCFEIYKDIQNAWMNFDYETLERLQTDEVYNNQKMKLEMLQMKNQQNVMEDIYLSVGSIEDIQIDGDLETVTVCLVVGLKDYVIDQTSKKVLRDHKGRIENTYLITYERTLGKSAENCPNCGAHLESDNSTKCPYCDSIIVKDSKEFKLSKKENKYQRRV